MMSSIIANVADRVGVNQREAKRFVKFAVVGAMGFIVDFGIFNLLFSPFSKLLADGTPLHMLIVNYGLTDEQVVALAGTAAGFLSFLAAIMSNFLWNRYWTYPDSRSKSLRRQFAQFVVVSVAGILIRVPMMAFTTPLFIRMTQGVAVLRPLANRVGSNLALMLAVVVVMFWNFFVNRYWTYADVEK